MNEDGKKRFSLPAVLALAAAAFILGICLAAPITTLIHRWTAGSGPLSVKRPEYTTYAYREYAFKFAPETWPTLSETEKKEALQIVINVQRSGLGLEPDLPLVVRSLNEKEKDGGVGACYDHSRQELLLDSGLLETGEGYEVLNAVSHQVYHSYERKVIEVYNALPDKYRKLYSVDRMGNYASDFTTYLDGREAELDEKSRGILSVEIDACKWAGRVVDEVKVVSKYEIENGG